MGDPETQPIMRRLQSDLVEHILEILEGNIENVKPKWNPDYAIGVVMASKDYPNAYEKGKVITGIEEAEKDQDVVVFHAGTEEVDGKIITNGGRVLTVTTTDEDIFKAREKVYSAIEKIHFDGAFYRKDIGFREVNRKK
jgi:phosphoribosylamine--glycine ligase